MTQSELKELQDYINFLQTDQGINQSIDTAKNFTGGGMMKVSKGLTSNPSIWNIIKNVFTGEKLKNVQRPFTKSANVFTKNDLSKFPVNRYRRVYNKNTVRPYLEAKQNIFKSDYKNVVNSVKTPNKVITTGPKADTLRHNIEVAIADKARKPVIAATGAAGLVASQPLFEKIDDQSDQKITVNTNKSIAGSEPVDELAAIMRGENDDGAWRNVQPGNVEANNPIMEPAPKKVVVQKKSKPKATKTKKVVSRPVVSKPVAKQRKKIIQQVKARPKKNGKPVGLSKTNVFNIMDLDKNAEGYGIAW